MPEHSDTEPAMPADPHVTPAAAGATEPAPPAGPDVTDVPPAGPGRSAELPPARPDRSVAELAHDLRIACMRVARRVRFDADNALAPHLFSILARLSVEPRTVGELATSEQVSAPSMSRAVGQLCDQGMVRREADEHDGRVVRLSLTDEGRELVRVERANRDAWMTARLEALTAEQRRVLAEATDLLEAVMEQ